MKHVNFSYVMCSQLPSAPPITGAVADLVPQFVPANEDYHCVRGEGVFVENQYTARIGYNGSVTNGVNEYDGFTFDASRSSSIYGRSNTIRPLSRTCKFFIRYM